MDMLLSFGKARPGSKDSSRNSNGGLFLLFPGHKISRPKPKWPVFVLCRPLIYLKELVRLELQ
jgi:hypothetical protein